MTASSDLASWIYWITMSLHFLNTQPMIWSLHLTRRGISHAKANVVFHQTLAAIIPINMAQPFVIFLLLVGWCYPWGPIGYHCVRFVCAGEGRCLAIVPLHKFISKHLQGDRLLIKHLLIDHKKKQQRYIFKLKHSSHSSSSSLSLVVIHLGKKDIKKLKPEWKKKYIF